GGGTASFSLSPSSGTYTVGNSINVTIYETSAAGDNVQGVQANLSYNTTDLQFNSVSESGSPFTLVGQSTGGSGLVQVGEASTSTVTGQQLVAVVNFTVLNNTAPNPTVISTTTGSDIQNSSLKSVWNGTNASASYTLN